MEIEITSTLDYARYHGLAINHNDGDLLSNLHNLQDLNENDDWNDVQLSDLVPSEDCCSVLNEPALQLTKESALLLVACTKPPPSPDWRTLLQDPYRKRRLKIEPPVLTTDHERDMRRFRPPFRNAQLLADLHRIYIPTLSDEDEIKDMQNFEAARENIMEDLRTEILQIPKAVILHLPGILRDEWSDNLWTTLLPRKEVDLKSLSKPISPPLPTMSVSPLIEPHIPSSAGLEFLSDHGHSVDLDRVFQQVKQECLERDAQEKDALPHGTGQQRTPDSIIEAGILATSGARNQANSETLSLPQECWQLDKPVSDVQLEMRDRSDNPSAKDNEEGRPRLCEDLKSHYSPLVDAKHIFVPDGLISTLITNTRLSNHKDTARGMIGEEFFDAEIARTQYLARLTVPRLASCRPRDFWQSNDKTDEKDLLQELSVVQALPVNFNAEQNVNWIPLAPGLMKLSLYETIVDDDSILKYVSTPTKITDSAQMLWKQPGLRCLDAAEDEDSDFPKDLEVISEQDEVKFGPDLSQEDSCAKEKTGLTAVQVSKPLAQIVKTKASSLPIDAVQQECPFSARTSLYDFLDLRGQKFKRPKLFHNHWDGQLADSIQATPATSATVPRTKMGPDNGQDVQVPVTQADASPETLNTNVHVLEELSCTRTIMLNSSLAKTHRKLVTSLEKQGGHMLNMLYRDIEMDTLSSDQRSHAAADIVLSSSTCIVFSHFQALIQKSLPGKAGTRSRLLLHDKIRTLEAAYEQIFVLMSMNQSNVSIESPDLENIAGFTAFSNSLEPVSVHPIWIDIGSKHADSVDPIVSWTWSLIVNHAFPIKQQLLVHDFSFIQEETMWEVVLRKAGLNMMSCQIVLGMLKPHHNETRGNPNVAETIWGLGRFVRMSLEEKLAFFEKMVTVSQLQAAHNFFDQVWG